VFANHGGGELRMVALALNIKKTLNSKKKIFCAQQQKKNM
jgi:hypothetical protein